MEINKQHNEHNIFGQIVTGKTPKGKLVLQMRNILIFSKSRDTKFLASHWQNFDNLPISPTNIPHFYSHANTAPFLTLQDYLLSLQIHLLTLQIHLLTLQMIFPTSSARLFANTTNSTFANIANAFPTCLL